MGAASWLGAALALAAAGCGDASGARALRLLEFRQQDFDSVALNEELTFYFSADLDRTSVTSDSVRILDQEGREVAGERAVRGNALTFQPELPCASDLSDGGLRPGESYRVVLGGFPRPDGIRDESGALLSTSFLLSFGTAEVGGPSPLFLDPFLGPFPLRPRGKPTTPIELEDGVLVLEYGEALDPSSVPGCRFELSRFPPGAKEGREPELIPLVVRLIENRRTFAALLLEPAGPAGLGGERLPPDTYYLRMPGRELRTLGGRTVEPAWRLLELRVPQARVELDSAVLREDGGERPAGCDGTASWDELGSALALRYPAAAGDGRAGQVELVARPSERDLHATRLSVPAGAEVKLDALVGPVVLRSQTVLEVAGRLSRAGGVTPHDPLTLELARAGGVPPAQWGPLSDWIDRLLAGEDWANEPWTVLIAGGDLVVPSGGAIEVEGPLVLVAGGWIRVEGSALARDRLWKTAGASGNLASHTQNERLPLWLDPPERNPLRVPLCVGARSKEFAWTPRPHGWQSQLVGHEGAGRIVARFLQSPPGSARERVLVDPAELEEGPARLLLRFELGPGHGERWDPPRFERLRLEALPGTEGLGATR